MKMQSYVIFIISVVLIGFVGGIGADTTVERNKTQTYIVDRTGERWDVTQAITLGFKPEKFQYGIGRNAFNPLDDSNLSDDSGSVSSSQRVIGVSDGNTAQAYSVSKLSRHEVANSMLGDAPIAVGY
jgi:hypothetical protein